MKIVITKEQYRVLVFNLLKTIVGKLSMETDDDNTMHTIYDSQGDDIMTIYFKGALRNKGCKKDLTLYDDFSKQLEGYIPYYKHKIFSEVLIDYVYQELGIKCDCIQYDYDFTYHYEVDGDEEHEWTDSKTKKYNVKKKKKIKESVEKANIVEQILNGAGVEFTHCGFGGRSYDNFMRKNDTVHFYFKKPEEDEGDYLYRKAIHYITKNNKVVSVDSAGDFRTLAEGLRYIPTDVLMDYFIEKGKTYLEKILPYEYPSDNLQESVIKEDNLKTTLLQRIELDGWEDTAELVGGYENLLSIVGEDKIISLLISCFSDLNVQKRGNDVFLLDWQLPILEKPSSFWGLPLKVFNDHIELRLEAKFGSDIIKPYQNVRREFIRELVSRFPDLYTSDVNVYKDSGLYIKYDSFSL